MEDDGECLWGSRRAFLTVAANQVVGISTYVFLPHRAVNFGALGHLACFTIAYITLGIPLFYMEYVIGQYTARDCLSVWHARPFLSRIGHAQVLWHLIFLIYCQTVNSAVLHYLLISFEDPIPYYECGSWSTKDCNILKHNHTVNQECLRAKEPLNYCKTLFKTYPEYQYWRYSILGMNKRYYHIAWRVGLASLLPSVIYYLSCFKRLKSVRWTLSFLTLYPTTVNAILMMGSMVQKGMVMKFEEALDTDFTKFIEDFDFSGMVVEVLFSLNLGTGMSFNLSSKTSFRAPCYSNAVITVFLGWAATVLGVFNMAMMTCPYAFEHGIKPGTVLGDFMSFTFEKAPRLLHAYHSKAFWLVILFSGIFVSALTLNVLILSSLLEMLATRKPTAARHPGLVTFVGIVILYMCTIPLLGNASFNFLMDFKHSFGLISILLVMVENFVFVLWYGVGQFSEDVHFMQGSQPQAWVKVSWSLSGLVLGYLFCAELYNLYTISPTSLGLKAGFWCLLASIGWVVVVPLLILMVAACRNKYHDVIRLDPKWGPRSEVLKRSRAMFTAHAMTKEYLYRQYHLQAGIISRQMKSNIRNPDFGRNRPSK